MVLAWWRRVAWSSGDSTYLDRLQLPGSNPPPPSNQYHYDVCSRKTGKSKHNIASPASILISNTKYGPRRWVLSARLFLTIPTRIVFRAWLPYKPGSIVRAPRPYKAYITCLAVSCNNRHTEMAPHRQWNWDCERRNRYLEVTRKWLPINVT